VGLKYILHTHGFIYKKLLCQINIINKIFVEM
jgi:hypothetical protein